MYLEFECPNCGHSLTSDVEASGNTFQCSDCLCDMQVPAVGEMVTEFTPYVGADVSGSVHDTDRKNEDETTSSHRWLTQATGGVYIVAAVVQALSAMASLLIVVLGVMFPLLKIVGVVLLVVLFGAVLPGDSLKDPSPLKAQVAVAERLILISIVYVPMLIAAAIVLLKGKLPPRLLSGILTALSFLLFAIHVKTGGFISLGYLLLAGLSTRLVLIPENNPDDSIVDERIHQ